MTNLEQEIIDHLRTICPSAKTIERAKSLNDVPDVVNDLPAIYVFELEYDAEPPEYLNSNRQLLSPKVLLQLAGPEQALLQLRTETAALKDFTPTGYHRSLFRVSGKSLDVKPSAEWWSDVWCGYVFES